VKDCRGKQNQPNHMEADLAKRFSGFLANPRRIKRPGVSAYNASFIQTYGHRASKVRRRKKAASKPTRKSGTKKSSVNGPWTPGAMSKPANQGGTEKRKIE